MGRAMNAAAPSAVETVVVGGGPAGMLCALELARAGHSVALVEQGGRIAESLCPKVAAGMRAHRGNLRKAERYRDQCGRCTCLRGMGGAAMHFDSNLGYVRQLSRPKIEADAEGAVVRFNTLERLFGSLEEAERLVAEGYATLARFGLAIPEPTARDHSALVNPEIFTHTDTADSLPAPLSRMLPVIGAMEDAFVVQGGHLLLHRRVSGIVPREGRAERKNGRWIVEMEDGNGERTQLRADNVVLAVGKVAMPWVVDLIETLGLRHEPAATVDIGVRLETRREDMEWMIRSCHYPKLTFLSPRGEAVRTFCVCGGGRLMQYEFAGAVILDGQHCIDDPTERTNFGILTTVRMAPGVDGAAYALSVARQVNRFGRGGPLVQSYGDFVAGRPTESLEGAAVRSSLLRPALGDLNACLPAGVVEDIKDMIDRLNRVSPGAVQPYALLAAPVVERAFPSIAHSPRQESSRDGLYFAGDCSGKIIGITYGMATGMRAGRSILAAEAHAAA
jgi:uncharacterized FAD-dependent dehydrogenase